MRTGAASAVGAMARDLIMRMTSQYITIAGLWRYGDGHGLHRSSIVYALAGGAWFQKHSIRQLQNDKLTKLLFIYKLFFSKTPRSSKITILILKVYNKSKSLKI